MYYLRHYSVNPYSKSLKETLENEYGIAVKEHLDVMTGLPKGLHFDVSELHPRLEELDHILPAETSSEQLEYQIQHYQNTGEVIRNLVTIIYEPHYLEEEIKNAKWFSARNIAGKIMPENCESIDSYRCFAKMSKQGTPLGLHETQDELYVIKSPVKWGRNAFVSAYCHEERLFCNNAIYKCLLAQGINGIRKLPVLRKSTGQPMDDIHQIEVLHTVPDGGIVALSGMEEYVCKECGMHMLRYTNGTGRFGIREGMLDGSIDIWQTQAMFIGRGLSEPHSAKKGLILSNKMYRFLVDHKLDRSFVLEPLEIIDR